MAQIWRPDLRTFSAIFFDWKGGSANFFAFRMYASETFQVANSIFDYYCFLLVIIYHFSELNPTCLYKFCLQALKDLSLSLSSFTLRFFTEIVQIDLNSYVWTPVHLSTGPGQYHLHAFCHLPAKWSNSFGLPEKNIILSLHVHQPLCWARLSFFLLTVLVGVKIFSPVVIISPPSGLDREEKDCFV